MPGAGLDNARSLSISPDGNHIYVAGDLDDTVAVFARDAVTGRLSVVEVVQNGVDGVDGLDRPRV